MKKQWVKYCFLFAIISLAFTQSAWSNSSDFNYLSVINPLETKNNLYQQILDEMNLEYEHIGKREAERVLQNKTLSVTGGLNSIGFTYRRPFVDFSISVDRNLAPDLFDSKRWIVTDRFSIFIDASKVLGNLKDQKIIDMSNTNLAAFAGIVFKRTYTWVHYANSYEEGLCGHFEKLFLPFTALQFNKISHLESNEMIFKEDSLTVKAGGVVSAPLYPGIAGMAGVLAKFEKLSRIEVVSSPSENGSGDEVHLSYEKSKMATAGVSVGIQADFLKILKITLLSYDFDYELQSSYKIYLNIKQNDLREMAPGNPVADEISSLLKNREGDLSILAPYIISEEKKMAQTIQHKYNFLLLGGTKSSKTQQIEVTTDGRVKIFFRHYYEKIKYTEDALSRLFASVVFAITNSESSAAKMVSDSKKVTIEYDSEKNLLENHEDLNISGNDQKLSLTFSSEFMTKKSTGMIGKKYRDRTAYVLNKYSGVDPLAIDMVNRDYLVAPFTVTGEYQVSLEGIRHLNTLSIGQVFDHFEALCKEYPKKTFLNFRNLFDHCRRSLQDDYIDYYKDLSHEKITAKSIDQCEKKAKWKHLFSASKRRAYLKSCLFEVTYKDKADWIEIPLWPLKNLAQTIVNKSNTKLDYYNLFGLQNVFFYGNFTAKTLDDQDFLTSFHEGDFKGLGVVDNYMRAENLRAPSSVVVDQ